MRKIRNTLGALALLTAAAPFASAEAIVYDIDNAHSGVSFKIRHLIGQVPGGFTRFSGEIHFDEDAPEKSSVVATIDASSIDTANSKRDDHLRNEDFFNVEKYQTIHFESTDWEKTGEMEYEVTGDLTMTGQTHPVTLSVTYLGEVTGRNDRKVSGWEASTSLDRTKWGITDPTGVSLGEEVKVSLSIQAKEKKEPKEES